MCIIYLNIRALEALRLLLSLQSKLVYQLSFIYKFIAVGFLSICSLTVHALSSTSVNTIKGTPPSLLLGGTPLTDLNQLAGFQMPKRDGSAGTELIDVSMAGKVIVVPLGTKFDQIIPLVKADGLPHSILSLTVGDEDGDADSSNPGSVSGTITATWRQGNTPITNLSQTISSSCEVYTLDIEVNNVAANTTFGDPNNRDYGSITGPITYILSTPSLCYARPNGMAVYTGQTAEDQIYNATGYNPAVWEASQGFSIGKMKAQGVAFPTTAFNLAKFTLLGSGSDQSMYRCRKRVSTDPVELSGTNSCAVTFTTTKPTSAIDIDMEVTLDGGSSWQVLDSYQIPVPKLWARPVGVHQYNTSIDFSGTYNAAIACGAPAGLSGIANRATANSYFLSRAEISNSPIALSSNGSGGRFARDLGTFSGEWGNLNSSYVGSGWDASTFFWTGDNYISTSQFFLNPNGSVGAIYPNFDNNVAVCRQ